MRGHAAARASSEEARHGLAAQIAQVTRLQRDLQRARARLETTLAELEGGRAGVDAGPRTVSRPLIRAEGVMGEDERISLRSASFEDLRDLGLSLTQTTRVLNQRREGTFTSTDDLDLVPGIPQDTLAELKRRLRN